jgi:di/tricarboxylate transporter
MNQEIITVLIILAITVGMLIFEVVRIDIVALLCMLALHWTGILTPQETLSGFSSNAVIAIMAVMILGRGITKKGLMDRYSKAILKKVGNVKSRLIIVMTLSAGLFSAFIQNIGSAALFLPGIITLSRRGKIPASALIMPLGFATILGGTLSMVGSSSLIVVNDLLRNDGLEPYGLFSVTPVGALLLLSGIAFFFFFGKYLLPDRPYRGKLVTDQENLIKTLDLPNQIWHYTIPANSSLIGKTAEESGIWDEYSLHLLGLSGSHDVVAYAPWRETSFRAEQELALLGEEENVTRFATAHNLVCQDRTAQFASLKNPERAGFAEIIIPSRSELVGQSIRHYALRKRYAVEPVMLFSKGEQIIEDFSDHLIIPGDTLIIHGLWENISNLKSSSDFVVATSISYEQKDQSKTWIGALCFLGSIVLAMTGFSISLSFFTGAVALVLTRVLSIQEAYQAIEWKVIFLLAGLIPLGVAMQKSGTAVYLAENLMLQIQGEHPLMLILAIALLSTLLSLVISNVGTVVVLTPLVMSMSVISGLDPRPLALMAAVCATNSFILPTHQVNAMLMSSGGYRNADYLRAGSGMTVIFLVVVVTYFYLFHL